MVAFIQIIVVDEISGIPHPVIFIEEQTGVDAICAFYEAGLAPGTGRIFGSDDIVVTLCFTASGNKGVDDVESSFVIADGGCPQSERGLAVYNPAALEKKYRGRSAPSGSDPCCGKSEGRGNIQKKKSPCSSHRQPGRWRDPDRIRSVKGSEKFPVS